jgi:hypothetical protein
MINAIGLIFLLAQQGGEPVDTPAESWLPSQIERERAEYIGVARSNEISTDDIRRGWLEAQRRIVEVALDQGRPELDAQLALAANDTGLAIYEAHYFATIVAGVQCTNEIYDQPLDGRYAFSWGHTELGLERSQPLATVQLAYIRRYNHVIIAHPDHPFRRICHAVTAEEPSHEDNMRHRYTVEMERLLENNEN